MNKRLFTIIGGVLLLIIIVVGFVFFVRQRTQKLNSTSTTSTTSNSSTANQSAQPTPTAPTNNQKFSKISAVQVVSPAFSFDQKSVWYFTASGHLYKQNVETGLTQEYVLPSILKVDNVIWPLNGNDFIVVTNNGAAKTFNYYNSTTKNFIQYPSNVRAVDFMPDGSHILYEWVDSANKATLSMSNPDLGAHKTLMSLPDPNLVLKISPVGNKVLAYKDNAPTDGKVYYITLDNLKMYPIKTAGNNAVTWSPTGDKFLFAKLGPDNNKSSLALWLGDTVSGVDKPLNVTTPLSKAAFDNTGAQIYFALPDADGTDAFWRMDAATLDKTQIFSNPALKINSANLMVNNLGTLLYFKNSDGFLYSLMF